MKYYYMDEKEIAIRTKIKNITSISTNVFSKTGKIILSCTVEGGLTLTFDNKSQYFQLFLDTLANVYEKEKDKRNIIILDDYTENILAEKKYFSYPRTFENLPTFTNQRIDYQKYDIQSLMPIIQELLILMFNLANSEVNSFENITGIRDRFILHLKVNNKEKIIPIKFAKKDDFSYELILGNIYGAHSLKTSITFNSRSINVVWSINGLDIFGKMSYEVDTEIKEFIEVIYNGRHIFHNEETYESKEENIPNDLKELYPGYDLYHLPNDLFVAAYIDGLKTDIHYISDTEHVRKTRNYYQEEVEIEGINCPIMGSKKVIEEYPITDDLTLVQEFFVDMPLESEYYQEVLKNKVLLKIIVNGQTYYPKSKEDITYIKSFDEKMLRKVIEEEKK